MADYLTLADIYAAIEKNVTDFNQADRREQLKSIINMVYLNEVLKCDELYPMHWLMTLIDNVKTKNSATVTGITKANPGVVTAAAHGFSDGDIVQHGVITGMTELSYRIAVVTNKATNTYELYDLNGNKIDTSGYSAAGTAGTAFHRGTTLSKSFSKIHSFSWHGYNGQIDPISHKKIEETTSWMDTATYGRPTKHLHNQYFSATGTKYDRLLWFTLPDANYQARIWGDLEPSRLSSTSDVPQLPFEFHDAIVSGSIARLVQYGQIQIENAVIWPGLYKMQLEAIKNYNRKYWKQFESAERSTPYLI